MFDLPLALDLLVAALVGLAVGVEREWSGHTTGPDGRFAGIRTFTLLGVIGGFGGWFFRDGQPVLAAVIIGAGALFPIAAYAATLRRPGTTTDGTTEVSAILVVAMGAASALGHRSLASAAAVLCVLLLAEKSTFQSALQKVAAHELRAALQFAVLALVILPLLPSGAYGPFGAFQPRQLWIVVLLFSGLNFAGYIARRVIGETRGLGVTGLLGGLVSSTAVSLTFSRRSRAEPHLALPLALGVVAACTVLVPRLLVISAMLRPAVATAAVPVLVLPFLVGVSLIAFVMWQERETRVPPTPELASGPEGAPAERHEANASDPRPLAPTNGHNPLAFASSLQMALAFQVVLFAIAWVQQAIGTTGVLLSATLLGLTDMDALTVSMTRYGADPANVRVAATAIGIGVLSNTMLKLAFVVTIGAPRFRARAALGLLALAAATGVGIWIGWP
ncbi:MgtC/SapB family protein [Gemmatimonas sp.]|uniref:MgtC/SapB family protein n=1 Tax=Gemmatimonas sp. TaxID=1962908 RepID=UPI00286C7D42|nr:MgtC/SapB family protein [Gemmatimonas sp.]